jgi:hypothetical protein
MNQKRLLIVGGEDRFVARIHHMLGTDPEVSWDLRFVASADEALRLLEESPAHLLVSESFGTTAELKALFSRITARHPTAAQLVVTPRGRPTSPFTLEPQLLPDSLSDAELRGRIEGGCALHATFADPRLKTVVGSLERLPPAPSTYFELTEAAADPEVSVAQIASIVERDPALAMKVLQLANSSFFGATKRLTSIGQAVGFLGITLLKGLVLTVHAFESFEVPKTRTFSVELFQGYSTRVARLARAFWAERAVAETAFTAGLVHDIGKMVIAIRRPREFDSIMTRAAETGEQVHEVEREVAYHQQPRSLPVGSDPRVLAAVYAADAYLGILTCGEPEADFDRDFLERSGADLVAWRGHAEEEATRGG